MSPTRAIVRVVLALAAVSVAAAGWAAGSLLAAWAGTGDVPASPWRVVGFPGQTKPFTRFAGVTLDGPRVLRIESDLSYGFLVHALDAAALLRTLRWRWRIDEANPHADLHRKDKDDSPVKVCTMFDLPLASVPFVERQVLRLARLRAGEHVPAANVCYVWDAHLSPGSVLDNAYTRRIRYIVLRGPDAPLRTWTSEQRDIRADFLRLYADEAKGVVPPLVGIAVGGDADNTRLRTVAHVGDLALD